MVVPPSKEVKHMSSLIPGMLILAMFAAIVVYGWWSDKRHNVDQPDFK